METLVMIKEVGAYSERQYQKQGGGVATHDSGNHQYGCFQSCISHPAAPVHYLNR